MQKPQQQRLLQIQPTLLPAPTVSPMAEALNPSARPFIPAATTFIDSSLLSLSWNPPPPSPFFYTFHQSCGKGAIILHPSIYYYKAPSLPLQPTTTHVSYSLPMVKYTSPVILESEADTGFQPSDDLCYSTESDDQNGRSVADCRTTTTALSAHCGFRPWIKRRLSPRMCWVPKTSLEKLRVPFVDKNGRPEDYFQFEETDAPEFIDGGVSSRTTVMIKNVPNKLSKNQLIELLDDHCRRENQKNEEEAVDAAPIEYDFLYLPMDFISGNNLGYAFVNYTNSIAAKRLHTDFHMKSWSKLGSRKVCHVTYAKIQGSEELVKHFRHSMFTCSSADYLPVFFEPSRNGSRSSTEHIVGKLTSSASYSRNRSRRKR